MPGIWDQLPPLPPENAGAEGPSAGPAEGRPPGPVGRPAAGSTARSGEAAAAGPGEASAAGPRVLSVGELTRLVRDTIRSTPRLARVWVEGEVGQVTVSSAGHCYFTLKDERAQLRCMIFRDDRLVLPLEPRTGLRVIAHGRVDVFEPQGAYQLYVDSAAARRRRRPRPALRGPQGAARCRGPLRRHPQAAAAPLAAHHRHRHLALGRRPPRHAPGHRRVAGRWRASWSAPARSRDPAPRSPSCVPFAASVAGRTRPRGGRWTSSSWREAAVPWRTSGPSTRSPSCAPSRPIRDPSSWVSATRRT